MKTHKVWMVLSIFVALIITICAAEDSGSNDSQWQAPAEEASQSNPIPANAESINRGKDVYEKECMGCHGVRGKGDGEDAAKLSRKPSDLSSDQIAAQSDGALFWKISTGKKPMPKFSRRLSENQRWDVVNYIRTFGGHGED